MNLPLRIFFIIWLLLTSLPSLGAKLVFQAEPYSHQAEAEPLRRLLADFLADQGIVTLMSDRVQGMVSGHFERHQPAKLFSHLVTAYGLIWYFDGHVLHIYDAAEMDSGLLQLSHASVADLEQALIAVDLYDPRYPFRAKEDQGLIFLAGPARYLDLVRETATIVDRNAAHQKALRAVQDVIEVFPLKYAWAEDQILTYMDREVVVPGVVTMLNRLLLGQTGEEAENAPQQRRLSASVDKLKGKGLAATDSTSTSQDEPVNLGSNTEQSERTSDQPLVAWVQADTRLNAVIIRDKQDRMPIYRDLISSLDTAPGMIEIQASVIDITQNASRELGLQWRLEENNRISGGFDTDSDQVFDGQPFAGGAGLNLSGIWGDAADYFVARIRALEAEGEASLLSQPTVVTLDNVEAQFEHNRSFYVRVAGDHEVDLFNVTAGVTVKVTPHLIDTIEGQQIRLAIRIEDGQLIDQTVDNIPVVQRSVMTTQAVVGVGQSLLLGGYLQEESSQSIRRVPGLGSVPVLRALFRHKRKRNLKVQRLFLITPRLLSLKGTATEADWNPGVSDWQKLQLPMRSSNQ